MTRKYVSLVSFYTTKKLVEDRQEFKDALLIFQLHMMVDEDQKYVCNDADTLEEVKRLKKAIKIIDNELKRRNAWSIAKSELPLIRKRIHDEEEARQLLLTLEN